VGSRSLLSIKYRNSVLGYTLDAHWVKATEKS